MVVAVVLVAAFCIRQSRLPRSLKWIALTALAFRVVGSFSYYGLFETFYGGGDYGMYYERGADYAERIGRSDFSMFVDSHEWLGGHWWATQFVVFAAGLLMSLLGTNIFSIFIVFSLLAFIGLVGFGAAFRRSFPEVSPERYLLWIWLFPSLWFWSAALGKDALLLCGLGISTLGFVGRDGRINWPLLTGGMVLVFAVRPQVAAVIMLAMVLSQWTAGATRWTLANTVQSVVFAVVALWAIQVGVTSGGAGSANVEGVQGYIEDRATIADRSGTTVGDLASGWTSAPIALVNILFRPFPWEARSVTTLVASAEVWGLWTIAILRRKNIVAAVRQWRSSRLLAFSLIFIPIYAVMLGLVVVNMGIIARQRIFLFPFIFLLLEARPIAAHAVGLAKVVRSRRAPVNGRPGVAAS